MPGPRHGIAAKAAAAWGKYESAVRCGGTAQERKAAFDRALVADGKLAEFDRAQMSAQARAAAARALSGA